MKPAPENEFIIDSATFERLFPFFLKIDAAGRICRLGTSLRRIYPNLEPGTPFVVVFSPFRPEGHFTVAAFRDAPKVLFVVRDAASGLMLRGQTVADDDGGFIFVCSPWISDPADLSKFSLKIEDFAVHDSAIDLLHVLRSQKMATADLKRLTEKLTKQRTQLKETNARLTAQEAETRTLALIAERTDNAVVLTDARGRVEWVNAGFTRLTGFTAEEVLGQTPGNLLQGPETDPAKIEFMRERIAAGEGFRIQILNYSKTRQKYWVDFEVRPIHDKEGRLKHFMAIETDITERRSTEANLRVQFKVSQLLAADAPLDEVAHKLLETIGSELEWNIANLWMFDPATQVLRRATTWAKDEALAENFLRAAQQDTLSCEIGLPGLIYRTGKLHWVENMGDFPSCPRSFAAHQCGLHSAVGFPIRFNDRTLGMVELLSLNQEPSDESQLRALESLGSQIGQFVERTLAREELQQRSEELARLNVELAAANSTKNQFLASISHEIRTPLNGVIGAAESLEPTALNPEQREALEIVNSSAHHLHAVLNDVLDFSRIEAGHVELLPEPTPLNAFVRDTARIFAGVARDKQLEFAVDNDLDPDVTVSIDPTRLRQILVNLLGNAFKFTATGSVTFRAQLLPGDGTPQLQLEIADTGIGIPPQQLEQLFKPFSQLDSSRTRKYGGTGLGLAISRHLATIMGGTIDIDPAHQPGSLFRVIVPAPLTTLSATKSHQPFLLSSHAKILVVDDNRANGLVLDMLLKRLGLVGHHCFSASEAVEFCRREIPAVILMDLHMPEMDGMEATRLLQSTVLKDHLEDVPIVALTADVRTEVRDACFAAGMDGFLTKPIRLDDLRAMLAQKLSHSEPKAPAEAVPTPPPPPVSQIDPEIADTIFGLADEPEIAAELKSMFREMWTDVEPNLQEIEQLISAGDDPTAQARCHRLRGVLANFGFRVAAEKLGKMETNLDALHAPGAAAEIRTGLRAAYTEILGLYPFLK